VLIYDIPTLDDISFGSLRSHSTFALLLLLLLKFRSGNILSQCLQGTEVSPRLPTGEK